MNKTYDVVFNDDCHSNSKGWKETLDYCIDYIKSNNGTDNSYFADYKGGVVSIVCNETDETVFDEPVKNYDVVFSKGINFSIKNWMESKEYCINYIQTNNGTGVDEFDTFSGGVASVVDNITNDIVYEEEIK